MNLSLKCLWWFCLLISDFIYAAPRFVLDKPQANTQYQIEAKALCATAKETLAYLNKGSSYDPLVIHGGQVFKLPLARVKDTLIFICQHQNQLNNPAFLSKHFDFYRWYPDVKAAHAMLQKTLPSHLPSDKILMTKYYVHEANISKNSSPERPYAIYAIPQDESSLTLEDANLKPNLIRFQYGKQAILKGALNKHAVPVLGYVSRSDLESALLQGTVVADFSPSHHAILNVHRCNNIAYDKTKPPYQQERYWYFKEVDGIKGYGKDASHKITVNPKVTFAADLAQLGLGKLLLVQYADKNGKNKTQAGILADTGGAFVNNLYQVDYLSGSYRGNEAFAKANRHIPDYVHAYFMVLKE